MGQKADDFWEDHQLRTMTGISFLARAKVSILVLKHVLDVYF